MRHVDSSFLRRALASGALALLAAGAAPPSFAADPGGPFVTVYTRDRGFVRETRDLTLSGARDTVRLTDVPGRIDFSSVRLTPAGRARVTRLAYRDDVASGDGLLDHARGSRVSVRSRGDRLSEGTLVAADGAWLTLRADDGAVLTLNREAVEEVRLLDARGQLSLRPTLEAVVEGGGAGRVTAELSYLTGGLSWSASYAVVRQGETAASWSGTVTVENQTGRDYRNARVKLVAGEPRLESPPRPMARGMVMEMNAAAKAADLEVSDFSEYHLYTLPGPATLRDKETQSLTLLETRPIQVTPRYLYRGGTTVASQLVVQNTTAAGLGVPLPAGRVRFYEPDADGDLQFTGETSITHTAAGEKLTLDVGTAFDLAAERRQVSLKRLSDREVEYQIEIKLRDRKKTPVTIVVEESVGSDHQVVQSSHPSTRKDSNTLQFEIPVKAGAETVVSYTVRVRS